MNWLSLPPLTALRAFAALSETGSASAAGDALNVSHAAISQQIKTLEGHMGLTLVDRSGRKLTLTPEGRQLAEALTAGFGGIARTIDALTGADEGRALQISTTPSFAAHWLMPRLAAFRQAHPEADLMLSPTPQVVNLEPGGIDIAIRYGTGDWPGLDAHLLFTSPLVAVAAPDLVKDNPVTQPADLTGLPWLQEFGTTEASDWLRQRGVTTDREGGLTQVPGNLLLDGLRNGYGVAVTVYEWVHQDITAGRLLELFRDDGPSGYYIVSRKGPLRPRAKAFANWLRREARNAARCLPEKE
ncbi:LysR family transcriptional regulator [Roseovarius sp. A21]|uniref:LysR family transcriptional regulator n=1 Tax=Roseovarius bejariae TaxID=2576383 RepID=A0A844CYH4_9RHOB|nr:LysR family transcriptional regulator [Roseovarius bejariae]MRU15084.1 LysR family transcriptional regulator [Roseovarius bejariae]